MSDYNPYHGWSDSDLKRTISQYEISAARHLYKYNEEILRIAEMRREQQDRRLARLGQERDAREFYK